MPTATITLSADALPALLKDEQKILPGVDTSKVAAILGDIKIKKAVVEFVTPDGVDVTFTVTPGA